METPNYILTSGSQIAVNMRGLFKSIGFEDRYYPDWFQRRAEALGLTDGVDFVTIKVGSSLFHVVSVATALSMLKGQHYKQKRDMCAPFIVELRSLPQQEIGPNLAAFDTQLILQVGQANLSSERVSAPDDVPGSHKAELPEGAIIHTDGPVAVLQIAGRLAVNARSLMDVWSTRPGASVAQWFNYRAYKLNLLEEIHYSEYRATPTPGHRRGLAEFIMSIDAAIAIADDNSKETQSEVSSYLSNLKRQVKKLGLPSKGKLSDFVSMASIPIATEPQSEPTADPAQKGPVLELGLFGWTPDSIEVVNGAYSVENVAPESNEANTAPQPGDGEKTADYTTQQENAPTEAEESAVPGESLESADEPYLEPVNPQEQAERIAEDDAVLKGEAIPDTKGVSVAALMQRVQFLELTVGQLVTILQSQSRAMMGLGKSAERMPEMTLRQKVNVLVNKQTSVSGVDQEELFTWIYHQLLHRYGRRVKSYNRRDSESYLQVAEREGFIDEVYAIVTSDEFRAYNGANEAMAA